MLQHIHCVLPVFLARPSWWFLQRIEHVIPFLLGKGYGTATLPQEIKLVYSLLPQAPKLAIDIGANIGDYTAALRQRTPSLETHLFEPAATNLKKLEARFSKQPHTTIIAAGVAETAGKATLFADAPGSGMASLSQRDLTQYGIDFSHTESIKLVRFEEYWQENLKQRPIDFIKIDIEGHELQALKGMGKALAHTRLIQFEFGGTHLDTRIIWRDFWAFFQAQNYSLYRVTPLGLLPITHYRAMDELFTIANYLALNNQFKG
jgi:FkbM family methyltransferase